MAERTLRLYFALPLPPELREALERGRPVLPQARWARSGGLHVTLAFLGERPAEALPALEGIAAAMADRHRAFTLKTAGLGGFPERGRVRVLWLGLEPSPALENLTGDLRRALTAAGETFDARPFRAHITLARLRQPHSLVGLADPAPAAFAVDRLVLYESGSQGSYTPLGAWRLRPV